MESREEGPAPNGQPVKQVEMTNEETKTVVEDLSERQDKSEKVNEGTATNQVMQTED